MNYFRQPKEIQNPIRIPVAVRKMLDAGESEFLDFKKEITSVHKIAKTISSFANRNGGKLLIGVNDDRTICGITTEEEKFMIVTAATNYCNPTVAVKFKEWQCSDKIILEVSVPESEQKPVFAKDENEKWWVYLRINDQTLLTSKVMVDVLRKKTDSRSTLIEYSEKEKALMEHLVVHKRITLKQYCKLINISRWRATRIIVNLISVGVLQANHSEKEEFYTLA
ncbi:MAG TPA: ATP-binding protein [Bacteroidia bacterium]|nr:ATP-binding protein [Bacteroidia bacterium]HNG83376.1 ATP-binding protein [Bacteroidia bacterium]